MLSGRETSKPFAVRVALIGVAVTIGLLGAAAPAAALPGVPGSGSASGSADLATGSASGSASGSSAAGAAGAAGAYLTWQSAQFLQKTIQLLLAVPRI